MTQDIVKPPAPVQAPPSQDKKPFAKETKQVAPIEETKQKPAESKTQNPPIQAPPAQKKGLFGRSSDGTNSVFKNKLDKDEKKNIVSVFA